MTLYRTLLVAIRSLLRTKTRSLLTILGVVIGVGAVIAMVSIGEGASQKVAATFEGMGTNQLSLRSGSSRGGGARGGAGSQLTITWEDLEAIRQLPSVDDAAPQLSSKVQVSSEQTNWGTEVIGTTTAYLKIRNWSVSEGETLSAEMVKRAERVAVIGQTAAKELFAGDAIGQAVRVGNTPFTIIGVLEKKGASPFGSDYDDVIIVPSTTFTQRISGGLNRYIAGSVIVGATDTTAAENAIGALLRQRHGIKAGDADDFSVQNPAEMIKAQTESANTITSLLAGVALISLLVGGIGIMNIMLVSVTERTREIGLRMAVGARPRDVLFQFLIEAVLLSLVGGLIGTGLGLVAASYLNASFGFAFVVRLDSVALAVSVSAAIGVLFGIYPSMRAARLEPIAALRFE